MTQGTQRAATWVLPWLMSCALFMETLDVTIISAAVPYIADDLDASPITLKLALTAYLLGLGLFIPVSGWAADKWGSRRIFCAAISLFTLGSALCGMAPSLVALVAARLVQGVGGAMMMPTARLVLMRSFPKADLVRITNYATIPALVGPALGPAVGGLIVTYAHWRWVFCVNVPFGLLGLLLSLKYVGDFRDPRVRRLDKRGFVLFGLALVGLSIAFETLGEDFVTTPERFGLLAGACMALALYGMHAKRRAQPYLNLRMLQIRTFRVTVLGGLLSRLGAGGVQFLLPLMLQIGFHFAPLRAGLLMVSTPIAMILMRLGAKQILRRLGFKRVLVVNTLFLGLAIGQMALIAADSPAWAFVVVGFVFGLSSSLHYTCVNVLTYVDVSVASMADATSIASTVQQFAVSFGVGCSALCLSVLTRHFGWDLRSAAPYHTTFACIAVLTALSSLVFLQLHAADGAEASGRA